jgi:hypothetical protein
MVRRKVASFRDYVRCLAAWSSVLWALSLSGQAHAEPLGALVRVTGAQDERLVERIRGQTSDLELTLATPTTGALEPTLAEQLSAARRLAKDAGAALAIWFVHTEPAIEVVVVDLRVERVLVRSIAGGGGPLELSAREEAAALVVRSAVKASLSGDALGEPEQRVVAAPAPPEPVATPVAVVPPRPEPPRPQTSWLLGVGAQGVADGASARGRYGLFALLALTPRRFELGLRGGYGLRAQVGNSVAKLAIVEHALGGYAGYALLSRERVRLMLALGASWRLLTTRVRAERAGFVGDAQRASSPAIDAEARVTYLPRWAGGHVGFALSAGCSALPLPIVLGYKSQQAFVPEKRLWTLQPLLALAVTIDL